MVSKDKTYTPYLYSSEPYTSKHSNEDSSFPSHRNKRNRPVKNNSNEEFMKVKDPTFACELKSVQGPEAWILGMRKYFQV